MLEAPQVAIGDRDFWSMNPVLLTITDAAAVRAWRVLDKLIAEEQGSARPLADDVGGKHEKVDAGTDLLQLAWFGPCAAKRLANWHRFFVHFVVGVRISVKNDNNSSTALRHLVDRLCMGRP